MKILQINLEKTWRGGERQTLILSKELLKIGIQSDILCYFNSPLHIKCLQHQLPSIPVNSKFDAILKLIQLRKKYDIIHCHSAKSQFIAVFTKKFHNSPIVYTRRVDFEPKGFLTYMKYKQTDYIIAISEKIKEIVNKFINRPIEVIYSSVEKNEINKERALSILSSRNINFTDRKIIGTIAALEEHKDPITLINAISYLSRKRKDFLVLHFGVGSLMNKVKLLLKERGLYNLYHLMGFYERIEDFFSLFDVFVISSKKEGLCSSILDAFVYKVPVVATNAGGIPELLENKRGILVPVGDFKGLANAINHLLEDPLSRRELIDNAYSYVISYHSPKLMTSKYLYVYDRVLSLCHQA